MEGRWQLLADQVPPMALTVRSPALTLELQGKAARQQVVVPLDELSDRSNAQKLRSEVKNCTILDLQMREVHIRLHLGGASVCAPRLLF